MDHLFISLKKGLDGPIKVDDYRLVIDMSNSGKIEKFTKLEVLKFVKLNVFLDISFCLFKDRINHTIHKFDCLRIELTILSTNLTLNIHSSFPKLDFFTLYI
jgi:hypothetical protein